MSEYEFKKGDWVQHLGSDTDLDQVWIITEYNDDSTYPYTVDDGQGITHVCDGDEIRLVRSFGEQVVEPEPIPETPDHHKVTIVSFQGAIEREVKRIVKRMSIVESISTYDIHIRARGDLHEDTTEIEFSVGTKYASEVSANTLDAALDEFMRRHGWEADNKVKQIAMRSIPV